MSDSFACYTWVKKNDDLLLLDSSKLTVYATYF